MAKVVKQSSNAEAQALDGGTNVQAQIDADAQLIDHLRDPAPGTAELLPPEPVTAAYELPSWAEFRQYVMDNGDKYVRASYPAAPVDLIDTVWCGIPVMEHDQARVMTPKREWLVY